MKSSFISVGECESFPFVDREQERLPTHILQFFNFFFRILPRKGSVAAEGLPLLAADEHQSVGHSVTESVELFATEFVLRGAEQQLSSPEFPLEAIG